MKTEQLKLKAVKSDANKDKLDTSKKPQLLHVAFIMDGNGRWAKGRFLSRTAGHKEGLKTIEMAVREGIAQGIPVLSFFAFSTENWNRPKSEVDSLLRLLKTRLPEMAKKLAQQMVRLRFCGDFSVFDQELRDILLQAEIVTGGKNINDLGDIEKGEKLKGEPSGLGDRTKKDEYKCTVYICLNYGGRQEIVNAANKAIAAGKKVSENEFAGFLYTKGMPDPDLLIRTGGEKRISNFFLYQLAYTELFFSDKLWPEFDKPDFDAAIEDFYRRNRRFGKL